jgi:WD40 repeat protein
MEPLAGTGPPIAFSPDGKWLATVGPSGHIVQRWTWPGLVRIAELRVEGGRVDALSFSPDGRLLAAGLGGGQINLWEATNREAQVARVLHGHEEPVNGVGFVEISNHLKLASTSSDKTVRLWDPSAGGDAETTLHIGTAVLALAISSNSLYLATVVRSSAATNNEAEPKSYTLQLWDFLSHTQRASVSFGSRIEGLDPRIVFAPNSQEVAVTSYGKLEFFKVPSLERKSSAGVRGLVYAPDGSWFAYISQSGIVRRSSLEAQERLLVPAMGEERLQQLALSPNGRTLAASEEGAKIWLWDARDGRSLGRPLTGHSLRIPGLAIRPDGKTLVSSGWDGRLGFWDLKRGRNYVFLGGHNNSFNQLAISPDGGTAATCGDDSTVRLWNVARRQEIAVLQGHEDIVNDLAFSSDGQWLASASNDRTVRFWHAPRLAEIEAAKKLREGNR